MRGVDTKLSFQEVGPIVLKVIVNNSDVVFNDNSTLTYTLRQTVEYQPKLSAVSMNATLVYPNFGVLVS